MSTGPAEGSLDEFLPDDEPRGLLTRAEVRGDLPPAARIALGVLLAGVVLGVLWALVAPGQQTVTTATGASAGLTAEADHVFDATALFGVLATAYGVVAGVVAWRGRTRRGPVVLVAVVAAATAGAWVASLVGPALAELLAGSPVGVLLDRAQVSAGGTPGPPIPATLATVPATIGSTWTIVGAGLGAVLAYLLAAIALGLEDLGRPDDAPDRSPGTD